MAIEIRRGLKADLPASATLGQLLWCTDTGELFVGTGAGVDPVLSGATFAGLTSGTNTSHMTVGTGGTIDHSGTGVVDATAIDGVSLPNSGSGTAGKIPITQGDGSAAWADPFVQGVYPPGTNVTTGGIAGGPINPVLIGGKGDDGNLHDLALDNVGQVKVVLGAGSAVVGHLITDSGSTTVVTGTVAVTQSGNWLIQGFSASGASNAGNPVKGGGVFNTTQPTVSNGQTVDMQATSRGAQIVATGVDTFNVTVNAALPIGNNTIGAVTQASGPWTSNLTQVAGSSVTTAASGVQQVGIVGHAAAFIDAPTASSVPANALYKGGRAAVTYPSPVSDGQLVGAMSDKAGRQVMVTSAPRDLTSGFVFQTTDASGHTLIAAIASTFTDITLLVITNESATATVVSLTDGTATYKYAIAANGSVIVPFNPPLPATTVNVDWSVTSSAVVTLDFSGIYVKNQ